MAGSESLDGSTLAKVLFASGAVIFALFAFLHVIGSSGLLAPSTPTSTIATTTVPAGNSTGLLVGNVNIGPCCPAERIGYSCCPSNIYSSRSIVASATGRSQVFIPLNSNGGFSSTLVAGAYTLTMTNCTYLGYCGRVFPMQINIIAGRTTSLNISIDTGIR